MRRKIRFLPLVLGIALYSAAMVLRDELRGLLPRTLLATLACGVIVLAVAVSVDAGGRPVSGNRYRAAKIVVGILAYGVMMGLFDRHMPGLLMYILACASGAVLGLVLWAAINFDLHPGAGP